MSFLKLYSLHNYKSESVLYTLSAVSSLTKMPTSLHSYRYRVVDVFTQHALEGNPLAVFPDASGIGDVTIQRIANKLNLSETVFFVSASRPGCAVAVRIFTPSRELPFAGHPTVGAG